MKNNIVVEKNKSKTKKRIITTMILFICFVIALLVGTFAYWFITRTQESTNIVSTLTCLNVSLNDENDAINLQEAFPLINDDGMQLIPYTFKLTNNCGKNVLADISLETLSTTTLSDEYIRVSLDSGSDLLTELTKAVATIPGATSYILEEGVILTANEVKEFDLRIWLDASTPINEGMNKLLEAKIVIIAKPLTFGPAAMKIINDNGGKTVIESREADFTVLANESNTATQSGLFMTKDYTETLPETGGMFNTQHDNSLKPSYYFRGVINNNWVEFANFYWRIIRVDGNGNIRLIYNGVADGNPETGKSSIREKTQIQGTHAFNNQQNDNAHHGFQFGTVPSTTYVLAHTKTNNSNAYDVLLDWYANNIANQDGTVTEKIVIDAEFCGDRNVAAFMSPYGQSLGILGFGANPTGYGAAHRLQINKRPSLRCYNQSGHVPTDNDLYKLPVGLITADEVSMAGLIHSMPSGWEEETWIADYNYYWTMSPGSMFHANAPSVWIVGGDFDMYTAAYPAGLRPVIVLKPNVIFDSGNGTINNMYKIQ